MIEIVWDQSVYIDETGKSSRLVRGNVRLVEKDRPQTNTLIPPGAKIQETIFPIDHIRHNSDGSLYQAPLFPDIIWMNGPNASKQTEAAAGSLTGKEVRIFLRLLVNEQKLNVTIPFKVVGVEY